MLLILKNILKELESYYKQLYKYQKIDTKNIEQFNKSIDKKLTDDNKNSIEGPVSEYECATALKAMQNNKSPGSGGITTEFYKIFWCDIKSYYVKSLNYSFENGDMTVMQKQGLISLLPKKNNDLGNLNNWRPLTLLNTDYKIIKKTISNRIRKYTSHIIEDSQTGFIKGRYIGENIRLIQETIEALEEENHPGLILFADFEKAFDSISHDFMFNCLKCFNFGTDIIRWIKCFYNDV